MKAIKMVIIGGGSGYTTEIVSELTKMKDIMPVKELVLVDVEEGLEKLETVASLSHRILNRVNSDIQLSYTLNRKEAFKDADFILTQFREGQMIGRIHDEKIPLSQKMIGQETCGAGGMMYGMRMVPEILNIVKDIEEICPDAWLINFANPASILSEAVFTYSNYKKMISICNGPINIKTDIAKGLNIDVNRLFVEFVGLNHLIFAKKVYLDGKDITAEVVEKLANQEIRVDNPGVGCWEPHFLRGLGMLPMSYLHYYWKSSDVLDKQLASDQVRAEVALQKEKELFEIYKDETLNYVPDELYQRGGAGYSKAALELIYSIYSDRRDVQTVNVPNNGAILGLEDDDIVEVNCLITKQGAIPLTTGKLPVEVRGIIHQIKAFEKMVCEAAVTNDIHKAIVALTMNPLVANDNKAKVIWEEFERFNK